MTKPRPPSKKFKAEAVSAELTVSAKLDIRAIIGTNGTNVPIKAQVMLICPLFSRIRALKGNQSFQNRAAININHHIAIDRVL